MNLEQVIAQGKISLWDVFVHQGWWGLLIDIAFVVISALLYLRAWNKDEEDYMENKMLYSFSFGNERRRDPFRFFERGWIVGIIVVCAIFPISVLVFSKMDLIHEWKKEYAMPYINQLPTKKSAVNVARDEGIYNVSVRNSDGKIIENRYSKNEFNLYDTTSTESYAKFKELKQDLGNGMTPGVYSVNVYLADQNEIKDIDLD